MNVNVSSMITEDNFLMKVGVEIRDGSKIYYYALFPDGIDLIAMVDEATQARTFISMLGGPPPAPKDQVIPYSHIIPLLDLWEEKADQLRRMRESGTQ